MSINLRGLGIPHPNDAHIPVIRSEKEGVLLDDQSVLNLLWLQDKTNWLYRGQLDRFYRPWPAESKSNNEGETYAADTYKIDSIISSDYRCFEDARRNTKKDDVNVMLAYSNEIALVRVALVQTGINALANNDVTERIASWRKKLPKPRNNYLTSLGQHIGLPSPNMDLTHSPDVAWWFATHSWGGIYQSGEGVIYRINKSILEGALHQLSHDMKVLGSSSYQLIDIGNGRHTVPNELTPRPACQQGLTLTGIEVGEILLYLIAQDAITAYVFQRDRTAYPRKTESIKPLLDPLDDFVKQAKTGVWNSQWQAKVNEMCMQFNPTSFPNVTDLRVKTAVFDGYDGLKKLSKQTP